MGISSAGEAQKSPKKRRDKGPATCSAADSGASNSEQKEGRPVSAFCVAAVESDAAGRNSKVAARLLSRNRSLDSEELSEYLWRSNKTIAKCAVRVFAAVLIFIFSVSLPPGLCYLWFGQRRIIASHRCCLERLWLLLASVYFRLPTMRY